MSDNDEFITRRKLRGLRPGADGGENRPSYARRVDAGNNKIKRVKGGACIIQNSTCDKHHHVHPNNNDLFVEIIK